MRSIFPYRTPEEQILAELRRLTDHMKSLVYALEHAHAVGGKWAAVVDCLEDLTYTLDIVRHEEKENANGTTGDGIEAAAIGSDVPPWAEE